MATYENRICSKHGLVSHIKDKYVFRCKPCRAEAVQKRRRKLKLMAMEHLGGKCNRCGYNKSVAAMHFHHKIPSQKEFSISVDGSTRSWERIKAEVEKCELLCANCHAEVHEEEFWHQPTKVVGRGC